VCVLCVYVPTQHPHTHTHTIYTHNTHTHSLSLTHTHRRNAMHTDLDGLHMVTVATADIPANGEILVSYGTEYWLEHQGNRSRLTL
jgi:hypothetical protein